MKVPIPPPAGVVIADPPWEHKVKLAGDMARHPSHHYDAGVMGLGAIKAIPVGDWLADDSIVMLWCTWPHMEEGFEVLKAWGVKYRTGCPWVKCYPSGDPARGIGVWFPSVSEGILIGVRGQPKPLTREGERWWLGLLHGEGWFWGPRRKRHSEKPPHCLHDYAETFTKVPDTRIELFARDPVPGWYTWGMDLGFRLGPDGVRTCTPTGDNLFHGPNDIDERGLGR